MIGFRMFSIKVNQFAILEKELPQKDVSLDTSLSYGFTPLKPEACITIKVELAQEDKPLVILETSCFFEIKKEDWDSLCKDGKIIIPRDLVAHFAMHAVGTMRGILFSKTEGTPFCQFILPPINVSEKITEDVVMDIE